ncbi:hypothetical protein [Fischerella sp. PCC 9605]|uniref:hypothetical protein n=2 Tax=Fischerella sp. PCC 9605 TaxID=1173024 RepID=UPI00047E8A58|nr:hypothetical protein [Fischerella sp. PCC 9605]
MAQPVVTIQDTLALQNKAILFFNRNQYKSQYRYFGSGTANVTDSEMFIDGISGQRLIPPTECAVFIRFDYAIYDYEATKYNGGTLAAVYGVNASGTVSEAGADTGTPAVFGTATPNTSVNLHTDGTAIFPRFTITNNSDSTIEGLMTVVVATNPESNFGSVV